MGGRSVRATALISGVLAVPSRSRDLDGLWPLIGRGGQVTGVVRNLVSGTGSGVLLVGDPGVGKTRLATAVLDGCQQAGYAVLRVVATAGWRCVPLGALAETVPVATADAVEVFRQLRAYLDRISGGRPVIVGVDDANWLDEASTRILERLVATGSAKVLASVRNSAAAAAPVMALRRAGRLDRVDVAPLGPSEMTELTGAVLGPLDGLSAERLWRATLGNPLFIQRLLRRGNETGALSRHNGIWGWKPDEVAALQLDELIAHIVGALSGNEATALAYLAYADTLPLDRFCQLVADSDAQRLEEQNLIQVCGVGPATVVKLTHPLYGEAVRAHISPLRRAGVLRSLVAVTGPAASSVEDRLRVTSWRSAAGMAVTPADLVEAADNALLRGSLALAEQFARQIPGADGAWRLAHALVAQGRSGEADALLASSYEQLADPFRRARVASLRALNTFWGLRQQAEARETLAEARRTLPREASADLLVAEAGIAALWSIEPVAPVLSTVAQRSTDPLLTAALTPVRLCQMVFGGTPSAAAAQFADSYVSIPPYWPAMRASAHAAHAHALVMCGRLDEATVLAERYYQDAVDQGSTEAVGLLAMVRGVCHGARGHLAEADRWTQEAVALTGERTLFPIRVTILGMAGWWSAQLREFDRAREAVREAHALLPAGSRGGDYALLAQAMLLAMSGQQVRAGNLLRELAAGFLAGGVLSSAMEALHLLSRVEPGLAVAAEIRRVSELTDSPLFALQAGYAQALATGDAAELARFSERWEMMGYDALAMEAAARAQLARHAGGRAGGPGQRVVDLRRRCSGFWPAWLDEPEQAALLTRREREVAELAAAGLSNTDIAARLVLSVRTVENHLQRSFDKLGIRQRRKLARALGACGPARPYGAAVAGAMSTAG